MGGQSTLCTRSGKLQFLEFSPKKTIRAGGINSPKVINFQLSKQDLYEANTRMTDCQNLLHLYRLFFTFTTSYKATRILSAIRHPGTKAL